MTPSESGTIAVLLGGAAMVADFLGVPSVGTIAGAAGGVLLAIKRLPPGHGFASWTSIFLHWLGAIALVSLMISQLPSLKTWPGFALGFGVGFILLIALPQAIEIIQKAPSEIWNRWTNR